MDAIYLSHYHHRQEIEQIACADAGEARQELVKRNASCARGWKWVLSEINFIDDDGVDLTIEAANEIRRACGCAEW